MAASSSLSGLVPYLVASHALRHHHCHGKRARAVASFVVICITDTGEQRQAIPSITHYFNTIQDIDWYSTAYLLAL